VTRYIKGRKGGKSTFDVFYAVIRFRRRFDSIAKGVNYG